MRQLHKLFGILAITSLLLATVGVRPAQAASFSVSSAAELISAINTANSNGQDDLITLNADIVLTTAAVIGTGLPVILSDGGHSLTIEGKNWSISRHSGAPAFRILEVASGANLTINHINIYNGLAEDDRGGAILNAGTLTINHTIIYDNVSTGSGSEEGQGGAILNTGTLAIYESEIKTNVASRFGGGITNLDTATLTLVNTAVFKNEAHGLGGSGIFNTGTATLDNTVIYENEATAGGGLGGGILNAGPLTITDSTIRGNLGNAGGGGLAHLNGTVTITGTAFYDNDAVGFGGAISTPGDISLTNVTIADNTASSGGGIYAQGTAGWTATHVTLSGNNSGGIYNAAPLTMTNSILWGNTPYNLDAFTTTTFVNVVTPSCPPSVTCTNLIDTDPQLGALALNGGPNVTMSLGATSSALDAGDASACPATDQRGAPRPQGSGCDVGAYEADTTAPTVASNSISASYGVGAGPAGFTVTFSEPVNDIVDLYPADDRATSMSNYMVVEAGANGVFDTTSCIGGLAGDDSAAIFTDITYDNATFTVTVTLDTALPGGVYKLFVCGTTSILDNALNHLNDGLSDYTYDFNVALAATGGGSPSVLAALPATGFAPGRVTALASQPAELAYASLGDIWLELPSQNIKSNIVGVPQSADSSWDVSWLGNDVGWLNGTAFPTWVGNSVVTAHVTNANGLPGPFANLKNLRYGEQIIVHLYGDEYVYEVRDARLVSPNAANFALQSLNGYSYLTLVTCQGYDPLTGDYLFRQVVRAVLVDIR